MIRRHMASEKDHVSAIGKTEDEKSIIQLDSSQQNIHRTSNNRRNSNKDSGISGSSNESVSQIPSPIEEGMDVNEDAVTNSTYDSM